MDSFDQGTTATFIPAMRLLCLCACVHLPLFYIANGALLLLLLLPSFSVLLHIIIFIVMTINIRLRSGHTPKHCMLIRPQSPSLSKYPCLLVGSYTSNSLNSSTHPIHSFINSNRVKSPCQEFTLGSSSSHWNVPVASPPFVADFCAQFAVTNTRSSDMDTPTTLFSHQLSTHNFCRAVTLSRPRIVGLFPSHTLRWQCACLFI